MNAMFNSRLASGLAFLALTVAIAISCTPAFARDLPGGAREPSPAGNVQGVQGGGGCRGAACNVRGPNPTGVKNVPKPKPCRAGGPCPPYNPCAHNKNGPGCCNGVRCTIQPVGGTNKPITCHGSGAGCGKQF